MLIFRIPLPGIYLFPFISRVWKYWLYYKEYFHHVKPIKKLLSDHVTHTNQSKHWSLTMWLTPTNQNTGLWPRDTMLTVSLLVLAMSRIPNTSSMVSLKVDNISYRTSTEDLKPLFEKYGDIGDIYIPRDRYVEILIVEFKSSARNIGYKIFVTWYFIAVCKVIIMCTKAYWLNSPKILYSIILYFKSSICSYNDMLIRPVKALQ